MVHNSVGHGEMTTHGDDDDGKGHGDDDDGKGHGAMTTVGAER